MTLYLAILHLGLHINELISFYFKFRYLLIILNMDFLFNYNSKFMYLLIGFDFESLNFSETLSDHKTQWCLVNDTFY